MLLVLMFHQIYHPNDKSRLKLFIKYIEELKSKYHFVNPFEKLKKSKVNVCLTFDDAYYDFYHFIFPELKKRNIPATLGIPTNYITEYSDNDVKTRLSTIYPDGLLKINDINHTPLCTWKEIEEMSKNPLLNFASHSHNHCDLTDDSNNISFELKESKYILEQRINRRINSFIYPFGKMNSKIQTAVNRLYPCVMRIGSSLNFNWQPLMYRINADDFWLQDKKFNFISLYIKYILNKIRSK